MSYVSLHNHTDASPDGAGMVTSLVAQAAKLDMTHLAITDHGTLANSVAFATACNDHGIIPIHGMEAYLLYRGKRHHLTLLSLNRMGFNNLIKLDSESHANNYISGYPLITMDMLEKNRLGLYALTGCAASAMYEGEESDAINYVAELSDVMNSFVAVEIMFIGSHDAWSRPIRVARKVNLPGVVTNDTHYPCRHQHKAHQAITQSRKGFTYDSQHLWLKTREEIEREGGKYVDNRIVQWGLDFSCSIAKAVEPWDMKHPPSLPEIPHAEEELTVALKAAWKVDVELKGERDERLARLRAEFRVLHERKFLDYIYILWDIVKYAKKSSIRIGPGRGSGGGSYVLYLLGITQIDPLAHNLMFERFLNPSRLDYPDVDVDFESDRRQEVVNYAGETWGAIPIATYSTYSHKSAVHDIARTLHIPKQIENEAAESGMDSDAFKRFIDYNPEARTTYATMIGQIRHRGKHAAGIIIPNQPVPIERSGDELVAAWAEGQGTKDLSKVGIVKYDLLGLTALSQLRFMEELTGEAAPLEDVDDPEVYDLFCSGDTSGVFQWSGSEGIRELTRKIAPRNFYDLTTCNALYRPGALDAGTAEHYPEFMEKPRKLHPRIDPHLETTYGVICYQEQVMAVVAEVMGGDLSQADIVRRLISKAAVGDAKWEREIEELHYRFLAAGKEEGFDIDLLNLLWQEIFTHSRYSYNLAHATAYTTISYQMAWYKVYHRAAFITAVLQYDKANAQTYILDAVDSGLKVEMPHVNYSTLSYNLHEGTIYLPLSDIAFLGERGSQHIVEERDANGMFLSYEDFDSRILKKLCNNRARSNMEQIGAFKGLAGDPSSAIKNYSEIPVGEHYENQLQLLGYVIPTPKLLRKMNALRNKPTKSTFFRFAGFVRKITKKRSVHGPYTVYDLSPEGSFWVRDGLPKVKVGMFVSGTKSSFGHSRDVKTYRLTTGD